MRRIRANGHEAAGMYFISQGLQTHVHSSAGQIVPYSTPFRLVIILGLIAVLVVVAFATYSSEHGLVSRPVTFLACSTSRSAFCLTDSMKVVLVP